MDINLMLNVLFGFIGIIALIYAIKKGKETKTAERKVTEIEQAITSYKYLKEKAFSHYNNGKYEECLDVLKKYLLGNKDDKEWSKIIGEIFKKETEKIYLGILPFKDGMLPSIAILIQAYISYEDKLNKASPYPELIKTLINDFGINFGRNRPSSEFIIALFDKDWQKAKNLLPVINMHTDEELSNSFKQYVTLYLNKKMGITDDGFSEDIPF